MNNTSLSYAAIATVAQTLEKPGNIKISCSKPTRNFFTLSASSMKTGPKQPKIAFISGPLAPSADYFNQHYEPRLSAALLAGDSFILGPSRGIDSVSLAYLQSQNCEPSRLSIYFTISEYYRTHVDFRKELDSAGIRTIAAGKNHTQRDEAMTRASDYDILRYLTKEECMEMFGVRYRERVSGTELNERRRLALGAENVYSR
jgi:hypothetical protein